MADWCGIETDRTAVLALYDLDAGSFDTLDSITNFGAALCDAPICLVSIVEAERQRFIASAGLDATETPRDTSFCAHAMLGRDIFVIPDACDDPRFATNPLVTGAPHIRFYAGAPLIDPDGVPLGALCVIDDKPRTDLTALQRQGLTLLARQVMAELDGRRRDIILAQTRQRDAEAIADSAIRFNTLADAMPQMVWSTLPDGYHDYYNAQWYRYTGTPDGSTDGEGWNDMFHPDDQARARTRWQHSLDTGEPYEIEYRLRHHSGEYRWTLGRALPMRDADGRILRWMGTCTEIHEQKLMMEEREIIAHELSHRIKNIFSVIAGLVGLSAREHPAIKPVADDLRDRIMALGRAHDFVRPHSAQSAPQQGDAQGTLWGVLEQLFAPYAPVGEGSERVKLSGENPSIDDRAATPLALLFHELATNAAKYGALSTAEGRVLVHVTRDGDNYHIDWREIGGPPPVSGQADGFGSRLMSLSAERQLGGRIERTWRPEGLSLSVSIPARAMSRATAGTA
jgi:PAS domain S-box-containing protein